MSTSIAPASTASTTSGAAKPGTKWRRSAPFAKLQQWSNGGWYAVSTRGGVCSGPWEKEKAQEVVDTWNRATAL